MAKRKAKRQHISIKKMSEEMWGKRKGRRSRKGAWGSYEQRLWTLFDSDKPFDRP